LVRRGICFVAGCHHSGTSLLTAFLNCCGFELTGKDFSATKSHPRGYFENANLTTELAKFFWKHKKSWYEVRLNDEFLKQYPSSQHLQLLLKLIKTLDADNVVIKDPRFGFVLKYIIEALEQEFPSLVVTVAIPTRKKEDIIASLEREYPTLSKDIIKEMVDEYDKVFQYIKDNISVPVLWFDNFKDKILKVKREGIPEDLLIQFCRLLEYHNINTKDIIEGKVIKKFIEEVVV